MSIQVIQGWYLGLGSAIIRAIMFIQFLHFNRPLTSIPKLIATQRTLHQLITTGDGLGVGLPIWCLFTLNAQVMPWLVDQLANHLLKIVPDCQACCYLKRCFGIRLSLIFS
jgi:hypothetical protein